MVKMPTPQPAWHVDPSNNRAHDAMLMKATVGANLSEIRSARLRHEETMNQIMQSHKEKVQEARRQFKSNIQQQIEQGSLTFAEAAEAEAALSNEENQQEKEVCWPTMGQGW